MAKRRFRIEAGRYGGEVAIGQINREFVEFFEGLDEHELIETIQGYEFDDDDMKVPGAPDISEEFSAWHECDDLEHLNNAYADGEWTVTEVPVDGSDDFGWDESETVFEAYHLYGREAYHMDSPPEDEDENIVPVLAFHSSEKGGFAAYFVETDGEDFNPKKLAFSSVETNVAELVENVWYDKELLEPNFDYNDTTGKGYYASVGYFNLNWHDKPETYTEEYLFEEDYWEGYDDYQTEE